MTPVFVFGAGPQGRVIVDVLRSIEGNRVVGFLDDNLAMAGSEYAGLPVYAASEWLAGEQRRDAAVTIAIGNNHARMSVSERLTSAGCRLHSAVHVSAVVAAGAVIGAGSVVFMQAGVGCDTVLGVNVVINTAATVDHDSVVEDGAYISPGVHTAGGVTVGARAFIGSGATLGPRVHIGSEAVVGAGAVVLTDLPPRCVAFGVPARVHRVLGNDERLDWRAILGGLPA